MAQRGIKKKRGNSCYQRKVDKITKWHNNLLKNRENKPASPSQKEFKPLAFYLSTIKKPILGN